MKKSNIAILIAAVPTFVFLLFLLWSILLNPSSKTSSALKLKHTGPVLITHANFTYHKTLQYPNGDQFEFYHCSSNGALSEEGATVNIFFTGNGRTMEDCAENLLVREISSPLKNQADLVEETKRTLTNRGYFGLSVYSSKGDNDFVARVNGFDNCDIHWQAWKGKDGLESGVGCAKNGMDGVSIVVLKKF